MKTRKSRNEDGSFRDFCVSRVLIFQITLITLLVVAIEARGQQAETIKGRILGEGKPLQNITVELQSFAVDQHGYRSLKTRTDAEGRFQFDDLPSGRYSLHPLTFIWAQPCDTYDPRSICNVSVIDGETTPDVEINLIRGGVLTGKVLQHDGRSAVEKQIDLTDEKGESYIRKLHLQSWRYTDDRGVYRIYGIAPGRYLVAISEDLTTYHPGVTAANDAQVVEVRAGAETSGIDILLKPPKAREKNYAIAGSVVAADSGAPIPGAKVRITFRQDGGSGWGTEARADNNGEFRFDRAIPGRYQIFSIGDEKKYGLSPVVEIEITDADVGGIELKTEIGARLSGEVVYVGTTSRKLEELFSRAGFRLYGLSEPTRVPVRHITIDRQGKFSMSGVTPGKYRVGFHSNGETGWMLLGIENGEQGNSPEFTIGPGETIENFRLLIDRGTGVIHGRIQFAGEALPANAGAQVMAWREGLERKYGVAIDNIDSQGFFRLEGLLPGRYTVVCEIQFSSAPVPDSWKSLQPQTVVVDVVEGQSVNLDLKFDIRP